MTSNNFENAKFVAFDVYQKESERVTIQRGDILMTRIGNVGKAKYIDWDIKASFYVSLALLKCNHLVNPRYLCYLINSEVGQREIWSKTIHVAFPKKINLGDIEVCTFSIPSIAEQESIAKTLQVWDQYLENLDKKIEIKKNIKKGLAQQIFSQKIRFKDDSGDDYPDWQECRLGDIAFKESSSISAEDIKGRSGPYGVYGASGFLQSLDMYDQETEYIAIVKDGAGVGRLMLLEPKSSVLGTLNIIKPKNVGVRFLYYLLQTVNFERYIAGSTIPHIYFRDYSRAKLRIPNREEQEKIQEVLFLLDEQISHLEDKRDTIDKQRKYLLNNLVTGKTRIPSGSAAQVKAGNNV